MRPGSSLPANVLPSYFRPFPHVIANDRLTLCGLGERVLRVPGARGENSQGMTQAACAHLPASPAPSPTLFHLAVRTGRRAPPSRPPPTAKTTPPLTHLTASGPNGWRWHSRSHRPPGVRRWSRANCGRRGRHGQGQETKTKQQRVKGATKNRTSLTQTLAVVGSRRREIASQEASGSHAAGVGVHSRPGSRLHKSLR